MSGLAVMPRVVELALTSNCKGMSVLVQKSIQERSPPTLGCWVVRAELGAELPI